MIEEWTDSAKDIGTILDRWRGLWAKPVAYTDIRNILILQLHHPQTDSSSDLSECAYIKCMSCQTVQLSKTHWSRSNISILVLPHWILHHTITDPGNLHVVCGSVFLRESKIEIDFHRDWTGLH